MRDDPDDKYDPEDKFTYHVGDVVFEKPDYPREPLLTRQQAIDVILDLRRMAAEKGEDLEPYDKCLRRLGAEPPPDDGDEEAQRFLDAIGGEAVG